MIFAPPADQLVFDTGEESVRGPDDGQIDPNGPTHFTVRYNENNDRMILHGRLREDGFIDFSRETLPAGSVADN